MNIKPIFAWYDFWLGWFWDSKKRKLYIFPIPTLGIVLHFPEKIKLDPDLRKYWQKPRNLDH